MAEDDEGVLIEFHGRRHHDGATAPRARTTPRGALSYDDLVRAAAWSHTQLPDSNFFVLWRTARRAACTARLGSGVYGTVFRVCKHNGARPAARASAARNDAHAADSDADDESDDDSDESDDSDATDDSDADAACTSCVAVKFGLPMHADGTVNVQAASDSGTWRDAADAGAHSEAQWERWLDRGASPLRRRARATGVHFDEVTSTQSITEAVLETGASPHVVAFLRVIAAPRGVFLFLEYVRPLAAWPWPDPRGGARMRAELAELPKPIGSLHALLRCVDCLHTLPDAAWRGIVFQMLQALTALQAAFPGFRHNDAKTDNWALTRWDGRSHTYALAAGGGRDTRGSAAPLAAWRLPSQRVCMKLLDFGLAHSDAPDAPDGEPTVYSDDVATARETADRSEFFAFGVVPEPCDYYDAHMLLCRALADATAAAPPWLPEFDAFVRAVVPPLFMAAPYINEAERLTADAQALLNDIAAPSAAALDAALARGDVAAARASVARAHMAPAIATALRRGSGDAAVAAAAFAAATPPVLAPRHALLHPYFDAFWVRDARDADAEFVVRLP